MGGLEGRSRRAIEGKEGLGVVLPLPLGCRRMRSQHMRTYDGSGQGEGVGFDTMENTMQHNQTRVACEENGNKHFSKYENNR